MGTKLAAADIESDDEQTNTVFYQVIVGGNPWQRHSRQRVRVKTVRPVRISLLNPPLKDEPVM